jgi:hypothetical protein
MLGLVQWSLKVLFRDPILDTVREKVDMKWMSCATHREGIVDS